MRKTTMREVKILRQLRHPSIVSLLEAFRRKGKLYLVFEYVEKNLLEVLEEQVRGLKRKELKDFVKLVPLSQENLQTTYVPVNPQHSNQLQDRPSLCHAMTLLS